MVHKVLLQAVFLFVPPPIEQLSRSNTFARYANKFQYHPPTFRHGFTPLMSIFRVKYPSWNPPRYHVEFKFVYQNLTLFFLKISKH